jgi:hypothetical protein
MPKHAIAIFSADAIASLRETLNQAEYQTPDADLIILRDGSDFYIRVTNADGDDPGDINDSRPCPGSPGCP